ncbi:DUF2026 family protein [Herbaspirillum sp. LeCh32-8]|uniref:DUF2026 family protein n=1 Tax=Herbaspirillum sp. LeCh32-8 TaxID=2821356 RepID=UPI001AE391FC|nr:DUF2026 family protein [Herbaspirillum sp. LeCh32-8]MBP0598844.1 DUF2026 family protein [Herbaspirillum sp. LeCh32-8]
MTDPLLSIADYRRIYEVIYTVLEASEIATTHRACLFFASAGTLILREHYGFAATISTGCLALVVDGRTPPNTVIYGRQEDGCFQIDSDAFHAWVECDGWLIDFMAPIMNISLREDGCDWDIPRKMLQKRLTSKKQHLSELNQEGDFFIDHDSSLAESLIDEQPEQFADLLGVCVSWFKRPPQPLPKVGMMDNYGTVTYLSAAAPEIEAAW